MPKENDMGILYGGREWRQTIKRNKQTTGYMMIRSESKGFP